MNMSNRKKPYPYFLLSTFTAVISSGVLCSVVFLFVMGVVEVKDIPRAGIAILIISFITVFPSWWYLYKVSKALNGPEHFEKEQKQK